MATTAPTKGQIRRDKALLAMRAKPGSTAAQLNIPTGYAYNLVRDGWAVKTAPLKGAGRGRPANTYKLSPKGQKRASVLAKRA